MNINKCKCMYPLILIYSTLQLMNCLLYSGQRVFVPILKRNINFDTPTS